MNRRPALIALEDGTHFSAQAFAGSGETSGELVFNTSMTGYQEILTDPSYFGQIVTLTYPLIGNYGVNPEDVESFRPHARALVVGECSRIPSNHRATQSLPEYLEAHGLIGLDQVDTRAITLHIRSLGAMRCLISTEDLDPASLCRRAAEVPPLVGDDYAIQVSTREPYDWPLAPYGSEADTPAGGPRFRVAVIDCGVKFNQLRILQRRGCLVRVFPITVAPEEVMAWKPDGLFVSNGPGDPSAVPYAVKTLRGLVETRTPTFGICFGHQLLGQALGGRTFKLKFGHRGGNQPVQDLATGKVEITSQNHGFVVDKDSFGEGAVENTHVNLNDGTSEGLRHRDFPVFSVQYHPEACPGPHDSEYLFDRFIDLMTTSPRPA